MKLLIVIQFQVEGPEDAAEILKAIEPPKLPFFKDGVSLVVEPFASQLLDWLAEDYDNHVEQEK